MMVDGQKNKSKSWKKVCIQDSLRLEKIYGKFVDLWFMCVDSLHRLHFFPPIFIYFHNITLGMEKGCPRKRFFCMRIWANFLRRLSINASGPRYACYWCALSTKRKPIISEEVKIADSHGNRKIYFTRIIY